MLPPFVSTDITRETDQSKFILQDDDDQLTSGPTPDRAGRPSTLPISSSPNQMLSHEQLSHQNKGQPSSAKIVEANNCAERAKRVRFKTKRYIQQC